MKETARKLAAATERTTRPTGRRMLGWVIALGTYAVLEAFDVLDLHIHLNPGPLEQLGLTLQHLGFALLAVPAVITGFRMIAQALRPKH